MSFEERRHSGWYYTPWFLRLLGFKQYRRVVKNWETGQPVWEYSDHA